MLVIQCLVLTRCFLVIPHFHRSGCALGYFVCGLLCFDRFTSRYVSSMHIVHKRCSFEIIILQDAL